MLTEFAKGLNSGIGWIPIIVVFGALPYLYVTLSVEVHKDYAELLKMLRAEGNRGQVETKNILEEIQDRLHVFELDWWVIGSIGVLMVMIFSLGEFLPHSSYLKEICSTPGPAPATCESARNSLSFYSVVVALLISFRIAWARVIAARDLKYLYHSLSPKI